MRLLYAGVIAMLTSGAVRGQENLEILKPAGGKPVGNVASYAIGYNVGVSLAGEQLLSSDLNKEDFLRGVLDALDRKDMVPNRAELEKAMEEFSQKMQARQTEMLAKNLEMANQFLEANKKKEGVQVTQSGLQYKVIKSGDGVSPVASQTVTVHYEGKLINGNVFDSSVRRGQPATFGVSQVIPGWTEALQRMKVGDKWMLFIPPGLAYGERGSPGGIGPNEALIFEVELLEVK